MSDDVIGSEDERDLAAEYALGLLSGDELRRARGLTRTDADFRDEVAAWGGRLAPLLDEVDEVTPPATAWGSISKRTGPASDSSGSNVVQLRRQLGRWRGIAGAMTALAASLALVLLTDLPAPQPAPQLPNVTTAAPLVAMLGDQSAGTKVVASWDPAAQQLILAVPGHLPSDRLHSHELWVIPQGGTPRSLGTMPAAKQMHMRLAETLARLLEQGATIAISVEPAGGSPTGAPTGPVVASGALSKA